MRFAIWHGLTWMTGVAAVASALLLAGGDASLPDAGALPQMLTLQLDTATAAAAAPGYPLPTR